MGVLLHVAALLAGSHALIWALGTLATLSKAF